MRAVIGQFSGTYSTIRPAKFSRHLFLFELRDIINILLRFLGPYCKLWSSFFPLGFMALALRDWAINPSIVSTITTTNY